MNDNMTTPAGVTDTSPSTSTRGGLIAASKVTGTSVYDLKEEKVGSVDDVMIDKISGRVAFAVLSFGGFLGIGEKYYPLPWASLRYDTRLDGFVVAIDAAMLQDAPSYTRGESVNWADEAYGRRVYDYWKVTPDYYAL